MKSFSDISKTFIPQDQKPELIHAIQFFSKIKILDQPLLSTEISCPMCQGKKGIHCALDPKASAQKLWFCSSPECLRNYKLPRDSSSNQPMIPKRALDWKLFCESSELGDKSFGISFEKIDQSSGKINFLSDLAKNPSGLLIMQGPPGTGKTYSALGFCELFTRKSTSCIFQKQKKMDFEWVQSFNNHNAYDTRNRLTKTTILVIDDFGLTKPSAGFLDYFLEILDARLEWNDRVTIITTNLEEELLAEFAGQSLADRLRTGQLFKFSGESRRERMVL